jgi:chemotaxis response regulator CheB
LAPTSTSNRRFTTGGLQAYADILSGLPADTGMAFVIAAHRAPVHTQLLPQLLSAVTNMPVVEVKEGIRLEPNRVFLIPPRMDLTTTGNEFISGQQPSQRVGRRPSTSSSFRWRRQLANARWRSFSPAWTATAAPR